MEDRSGIGDFRFAIVDFRLTSGQVQVHLASGIGHPVTSPGHPPYCALRQEGLYSKEHRLLIEETFTLDEVGGEKL